MGLRFAVNVFECFYSATDASEYETMTSADNWNAFLAQCCQAGASAQDICATIMDPLPWDEYRSMVNRLLTPGIKGSVLPVESLYKNWSDDPENEFATRTGMYMGDHALHMRSLYKQFNVSIPEHFNAMPDHLALELEFYALLMESGREDDAATFVADHLDWLGTYRQKLEERAAAEEDDRFALVVDFLKRLTGLLIVMLEESGKEGDGIEDH